MVPPDPLRQKMLCMVEMKSISVEGGTPSLLSASMNQALLTLRQEGYNVSQILPLATNTPGFLVLGQRVSSPVANPTPDGVPVPGTNATQSLEVIYSFVINAEMKTAEMPSLQAAVRKAAEDLQASAAGNAPQPISIHVTSITSYGPGDLHALVERFK